MADRIVDANSDGSTRPRDWVDRVVGLDEVRVEIAFARTPDGYGRLELTRLHNPGDDR